MTYKDGPQHHPEFREIYEAGIAEGRRLERRALKRWADGLRQIGQSAYNAHVSAQDINDWIVSRADKPAKRKEG